MARTKQTRRKTPKDFKPQYERPRTTSDEESEDSTFIPAAPSPAKHAERKLTELQTDGASQVIRVPRELPPPLVESPADPSSSPRYSPNTPPPPFVDESAESQARYEYDHPSPQYSPSSPQYWPNSPNYGEM